MIFKIPHALNIGLEKFAALLYDGIHNFSSFDTHFERAFYDLRVDCEFKKKIYIREGGGGGNALLSPDKENCFTNCKRYLKSTVWM